MKIVENMGGGTTVILGAEENLKDVPAAFQNLLTDKLVGVFRDPAAYFRTTADRAHFPSLNAWLRTLADEGQWRLMLHETFLMEQELFANFYWHSTTIRSAMIALPKRRDFPRYAGRVSRLLFTDRCSALGSGWLRGGSSGERRSCPAYGLSGTSPEAEGIRSPQVQSLGK